MSIKNQRLIKEIIDSIFNGEKNRGVLKQQLNAIKKDKDLKDRVVDGVFDKLFPNWKVVNRWVKTSVKLWLYYNYGI